MMTTPPPANDSPPGSDAARRFVCAKCGYDLSGLQGCTDARFVCPECGAVGSACLAPRPRNRMAIARRLFAVLVLVTALVCTAFLTSTGEDAFGFPTGFVSEVLLLAAWAAMVYGIWVCFSTPNSKIKAVVHAVVCIAAAGLIVGQIIMLAWLLL